eukprot:TRINITY_DN1032_c0_g1_i3.p1 TRINITY_DN1032_c0_g1~~TRINITY_DN1032_c0_g1_i3.p1  ORF type:complete len:141 (-),score=36.27 TRINITY_DN1032_c0_g1_i3:362-784(-)
MKMKINIMRLFRWLVLCPKKEYMFIVLWLMKMVNFNLSRSYCSFRVVIDIVVIDTMGIVIDSVDAVSNAIDTVVIDTVDTVVIDTIVVIDTVDAVANSIDTVNTIDTVDTIIDTVNAVVDDIDTTDTIIDAIVVYMLICI